MKLFTICMFVFVFGATANSFSQKQVVTLNLHQCDVSSLFQEIWKQTGLRFVYNEKHVADFSRFDVKAEKKAVEEVLDKVFKNSSLKCVYENNVIFVIPKEQAFMAADSVRRVTVKGKVTDEDGFSIPGVTVILKIPGVKDNKIGTATNEKGVYELAWVDEKNVTLVFSFIGMETKEVKYTGQKEINVVLKEEQKEMDEVVITGFIPTTKRKATGSVGVLTRETFEGKAQTGIDQLLQGQIAGVSIQAISGRPGESVKIRIRGSNTLTGEAEPLWVVDGVPLQKGIPEVETGQLKASDFNNIFTSGIAGINPNDIENITILKDASATAIYGSRAAGGVIVVTTKRGKGGKMQVSYSANVSVVMRPQRDGDLMNSREKLNWEQELWNEFSAEGFASTANDKWYPVVGMVGMLRSERYGKNGIYWNSDSPDFQPYSTAEQDALIEELASHTTDWFKVLFRDAVSTGHHLSLSGGGDKVNYYMSLGYNKDNGILRESGYNRYTLATNIDVIPSDRVKIGLGFDLAQQKSEGAAMGVNPFEYAYFANPYERPYNDDGSYRPDLTYYNLSRLYSTRDPFLPPNGYNVLRELKETSSVVDNFSTTVRGSLDLKLTGQFSFSGLASYSFTNDKSDNIKGQDTYAAFKDRLWFDDKRRDVTYGSIMQTSANNTSYSLRGHFVYENMFGDAHRIVALAGAEIRGEKGKSIFEKRYGYDVVTGNSSMPLPPKPADGSIDYSMIEKYADFVDGLAGQGVDERRYASFFGSADYHFKGKYILSFSFRTDGSDRFGSKEQFNPTWSLGGAWHVDEENFMEGLKPVLSSLTLRVAGGYTGNINSGYSPVLIMDYLSTYRKWENVFYREGQVWSAPNPRLRWEKTRDMKVSLDFGLFDGRITGLVEGYHRLSTDVVTSVRVVSTTGFSSQGYNTSKIENKGLEVTLNSRVVDTKDFKLSLSANFAVNRNKLKDFKSPNPTVEEDNFEGYPKEAIFGGKDLGIDPETGTYAFELRSDADIQKASDLKKADNYRFYLGTSVAPYTGGFNVHFSYKTLSLNVGGNYWLGAKVYNKLTTTQVSYNSVGGGNAKIEGLQIRDYNDLYRNHLNVRKDRTNRWTAEHPTGNKYPRIVDVYAKDMALNYYDVTDVNITRSVQLENTSFLRINNISFMYKVPADWISRCGLSSLALSMTLNNFFTFTNYSGIDPESPGATYPKTRSLTFGLNVGF